jgi:hypothetical protein
MLSRATGHERLREGVMPRIGWGGWIAAAVAAGAAAIAGVIAIAGREWDGATSAAVAAMAGAGPYPTASVTYDPLDLSGLPEPVIRYFRFPLVAAARIEHAGEFSLAADRWHPFTSTQWFRVSPAGFVWDARIRMAPMVDVHVRDGYLAGEGSMHARVAGVLPVVDQRGTPELASGALARAFAERTWLPTALLPSAGVRWSPLDDRSARAILEDGDVRVGMDVHFGADGSIERIEAMRFRDVDGVGVATPFRGTFARYERNHGMMIPMEGEVAWWIDGSWIPYWRGGITQVEYRFAE